VAWILLYLLALAAFGALLVVAGIEAAGEVQYLVEIASVQEQWGLPLGMGASSLPDELLRRLPMPSKIISVISTNAAKIVAPAVLGVTQGAAGVISGLVISLILGIYWIAGQDHFERLWLSLVPSGRRNRARSIWRSIETAIGAYIRGQIAHSLLFGVLLGLGFWALGSRFPVVMALVGALARFVPVAGMAFALITVLLVGLLASGQLGLFMFLYMVVVVAALEVWVKPRLAEKRWSNPILTLVILIAMADTAGLVGLILAPPLAVLAQILWTYLFVPRPAPSVAAQVVELRQREQRLKETIVSMGEAPPPVVASSLQQLGRLIDRAEPVLQAAPPESSEPLA